MTSMIDVVFLLLIFFLVTSAFVPTEKQLPATIRYASGTNQQAARDLEPAVIDIRWQDPQVVYRLGGVQTRDRQQILDSLKRSFDKAAGAFVRVDDAVPFDHAAQLIHECRQMGFQSVTYIPLPATTTMERQP
jgi:biopolymer transport protein ExbD